MRPDERHNLNIALVRLRAAFASRADHAVLFALATKRHRATGQIAICWHDYWLREDAILLLVPDDQVVHAAGRLLRELRNLRRNSRALFGKRKGAAA